MRRRDAEGKESGWLVDLWNVFRKIGEEKKKKWLKGSKESVIMVLYRNKM